MKSLHALLAALVVVAGTGVAAQSQEKPTIPNLPDVNHELLEIVVADQWDRGMDMFSGRQVKAPESLDWQQISARDVERKKAVRSLLGSGEIKSGREFQFAALVFQHSADSADLHTAHILATTAVAKGNPHARWLAAASLDRLLWNLDRPQVFGTQFKQDAGTNKWTMDPYDRESIPDTVRAAWCVVGSTEQARILKSLEAGAGNPSTSVPDCK